MAKAKRNRGRQAIVGRYFRGLPVIEAAEPLRIIVNSVDKGKSKRLDPNNCVFAQACKRLFNSHAVLFLRTTAYVELPDSKGRRTVNRFKIPVETRNAIVTFDKTGEAPEGGFIIVPPTKCNTMSAHTAYSKRYQEELRTGKRKITRRYKPSRVRATLANVRDGRGKLGINYAF